MAVCLASGCGEKIEPGRTVVDSQPTVKAAVATAQILSQPRVYETVGTISSRSSSILSSKIMGAVKEVHVREGDRVRRGDVLVVLDDRQVSAGLLQASEALAEAERGRAAAASARDAARAGADLSKATYQRYLKLLEQESASPQEFDEVEARHRQAQASLARAEAALSAAGHRTRQAEAAVAAARVTRNDARIQAPFDGTVTDRKVEPGDLAAPGTPLIALERTGEYRVDLVVPETYIRFVKTGQTIRVLVGALAGESLEGVVKTIVPAADPAGRSFGVKADLPENHDLRSGMFARVTLPTGEDGLILVPSRAVIRRGQLDGVFVLDADRIARFRLVRLGRTFDDAVEVISGLKPGTRYVAEPAPELTDGTRVEVDS